MNATPNIVARNTNDVCPMSDSNADEVTVTSTSQHKEVHINYITPTRKDPPECRAHGNNLYGYGR